MDLTSPSVIKELLSKYETRPSKGLGQNFLIDKNILQKIVAAADLKPKDIILEVGPGVGTLTQELAGKAKEVIGALRPITGGGRFLFPSERSNDRPMSENTVNGALRRLGYSKEEMTSHGFRSMASTLLNEQGWNRDAIERQLAHAEQNKVKAAYNRAQHLPERRQMMQSWADYLDGLKAGAQVIPIRRNA